MKKRLKMKMELKSKFFLEKVKSNKEIMEEINNENKKFEKDNESKDEIMCFYCRHQIKLTSFEVPFGKTGLLINDYFYINSQKSTVRRELQKIQKEKKENNDLYRNLLDYNNNTYDKMRRIISCGHYFHSDCFKKGCTKFFIKEFNCPLCLKKQNILIPPLNNFKDKFCFLKSENIQELFDEKIEEKKMVIIEDDNLIKDAIFNFFVNIGFLKINQLKEKNIEYELFLDSIFMNYKGFFNFFENIFYIDGTTFHKHQQIDTMQNIILSLRYLTNIKYLNEKEIINYIKKELASLLKGPDLNEIIILKYEDMYYVNKFEKILLSLSILFDYEEQIETFKYIIYIFLPYMAFGYYLRYLSVNRCNFNNINTEDFKTYLENNNTQMINYFYMFLQKFLFLKILTDFSNKNEELYSSFNQITTEKIFSLLYMDNLYKMLINDKKDIIYLNIFEFLPKIFNLNDLLFKQFKNNYNYVKIFDLFILITKQCKIPLFLSKEFIINFSPIKFDFIHLDDDLFDWIENTLEKKCIICSKTTKYDYICLICGNKICHTKSCNKYTEHIKKCGGDTSIFIDMDNMKASMLSFLRIVKTRFPLYVNENGVGPSGNEISSEFKLSQEKIKLAINTYVCNDFHFN